MQIIVAKSAGFCFGVNKAVNMVYDLLETTDKPIFTLGPIIHNNQVVNSLNEKGVQIIDEVFKNTYEGNIVIRAHGVTPQIYRQLIENKFEVFDATCPYVKKIHNLVKDKYTQGNLIIIVGDINHPEVIGINGWCDNKAQIVYSNEDIEKLDYTDKSICVVSQTTVSLKKWNELIGLLEDKFPNIDFYDTICSATNTRQKEAEEISKEVDMMIVIGGSNSSNTHKLYEICKENCKNTYKIETVADIPYMNLSKIKKIGITAGASTPKWVIKEVLDKMKEIDKEEMDFEKALNDSLVELRSGDIVKGEVIGVNDNEVFVNLHYKSDGVISKNDFSNNPDIDLQKEVQVGEEIEVFIVNVNDRDGNVILSKKKIDEAKHLEKIKEAYSNKNEIKARVNKILKGGVLAESKGVNIFVPMSQLSTNYVKDLNTFKNAELRVRIIEFDERKRKIVGSQRVILEEEKVVNTNELFEDIEIGKEYTGVVKNLTNYGAFVEIGGVDALIHISELAWTRVKHPSELLKVGETVKVTVIDYDKENKKISLRYKSNADNPWNIIKEKYKVGDVIQAKVVRFTSFGAFAEVHDGVDGLIHISQISDKHIAKPSEVLKIGEIITAKIIELDSEDKKINLSIKEVNSQEESNETSEHKEDMNSTIGEIIEEN